MTEYCDTLQSKEKRHWEYKACLNERAILRLLDQRVTMSFRCFVACEKGDFSKNSDVLQFVRRVAFMRLMGSDQEVVASPVVASTLYMIHAADIKH